MKQCSKCGQWKNECEFYKDKRNKNGLQGRCKICFNQVLKGTAKVYRQNNQEKIKRKNKRWYESNKERINERNKKWKQNNKEKVRRERRKYKSNNIEKIRSENREYQRKNRGQINVRERKRRQNNSFYRLNANISRAVRNSLKTNKSGWHWEHLVGYTLQELREHLEKQFDDEMSWDNYGSYWHIDHIVPKSWFIFEKPEDEEFKQCWALENLQPLEAKENLLKYNKYKV